MLDLLLYIVVLFLWIVALFLLYLLIPIIYNAFRIENIQKIIKENNNRWKKIFGDK